MRWTEQDLQALKAKSRVIVHKQDDHVTEPRTNTGTKLPFCTEEANACLRPDCAPGNGCIYDGLTGTDPEKGAPNAASGFSASASGHAVTGVASVKTRKPIRNTSRASQALRRARESRNWGLALKNQCKALKLPIPVLEYRFHPSRKWRFDCAWIAAPHKPWIAVEIEGGLWIQGRHNRAQGFINDMHKYNEAVRLGWRVFRFSTNQVKVGTAVQYLKKVLV